MPINAMLHEQIVCASNLDLVMDAALDTLDRPQHSLRLSVIDRCNFRCDYCMPQDTYQWLPKDDILSFEEMGRLARVFEWSM